MQYLGNKSDKQKIMLMRSVNIPEINLLEPDIGMTISSPTNLVLSFKAKNGSKVDVESLKILYGWLGFDITNRIKKHALITASGISAENVTLPEGNHVILVTIRDTDGRFTEKEIEFTIE